MLLYVYSSIYFILLEFRIELQSLEDIRQVFYPLNLWRHMILLMKYHKYLRNACAGLASRDLDLRTRQSTI